jgi:hypothetical protein
MVRMGLLAVLAAVSLAACGGGGDGDDDGVASLGTDESAAEDDGGDEGGDGDGEMTVAEREDAMLEFTECMREHGVDMPDPEPGGGVRINGAGIPPEQMEAAQADCQKWMDMAMPEDGGGRELTEEQKQSFLDMAACMRDRGYNFPDPTFEGGRVTQRVQKPEGGEPGPEDPAFEQDRGECEAEAGMEPPGDGDSGGSLDEQEG